MKRKTVKQLAHAAADKKYPDIGDLGALTFQRRQHFITYKNGYLAGYKAARRSHRVTDEP